MDAYPDEMKFKHITTEVARYILDTDEELACALIKLPTGLDFDNLIPYLNQQDQTIAPTKSRRYIPLVVRWNAIDDLIMERSRNQGIHHSGSSFWGLVNMILYRVRLFLVVKTATD